MDCPLKRKLCPMCSSVAWLGFSYGGMQQLLGISRATPRTCRWPTRLPSSFHTQGPHTAVGTPSSAVLNGIDTFSLTPAPRARTAAELEQIKAVLQQIRGPGAQGPGGLGQPKMPGVLTNLPHARKRIF